MSNTLDILGQWINRRETHYVCVTGVHGVMESQRDEKLRHIHNVAGLVVPDGMPLVWLGRLKGHKKVQRIYGPDLMLSLCEHSLKLGYRHFFFGGAAGVPESLSANLRHLFPGLVITGTYSPPFRALTDEEDRKIVEIINGTEPDIVWIGLSTPKQERWMADHIGRLTAPVLIGVGAAFDFLSGSKRQAPRWMQHSGLEWFFRLITEPRRLWRRYLINNPAFLWLILLQTLGIKKYSLD
jgi:N-acetylglucosaminyldiphosphoundecaprenol N-acetyl-beta-D-mannosaminyltransferase